MLWALYLFSAVFPAAEAGSGSVWSTESLVRHALERNAQIEQAEAKVLGARALLAEVQTIYYPKLMGRAYGSPVYTVEGDINGHRDRYKSIQDWGPYLHLDATLAMPLYQFGRIKKAKNAARAKIELEQARVRTAQNAIALEVRSMAAQHLFAKSMLPSLRFAQKKVDAAISQAEEDFEEANGHVTQVDLSKLEYAQAEVEKALREAQDGEILSLLALRHLLGLAASSPIRLEEGRLKPSPYREGELELSKLLHYASQHRPEWQELDAAERATLALAAAERLAMAPTVFMAGHISLDWSPVREDAINPYHFDQFNNVFGGFAIGLDYNVDVGKALSKGKAAEALYAEAQALKRFAQSGIPASVQRSHMERERLLHATKWSTKGQKAAQKWVTFAGNAFMSGTGDAGELLEGLVSYINGKKSYYESLRDSRIAEAELLNSLGVAYDEDNILGTNPTLSEPKVPATRQ